MTKILATLTDFDDRIVTIAKAHYGVKSKAAAIQAMIRDAADDFLAIKPEIMAKLRRLEGEPKLKFKTPEELRKYLAKQDKTKSVPTSNARMYNQHIARQRTGTNAQKATIRV